MKPTRVAVIQAAPVAFDTSRTLEKVADSTRDASTLGAALAVFPDALVGGYPKGLDFGARVGTRSDAGRDQYRRYYEATIDVPGQSP